MKVGIDCRFAPTMTGLGTYVRNITKAILNQSSHEYVLFVHSKDEEWIAELPQKNFEVVESGSPVYSLREQLHFPSVVKKSKIDLLFCPHFNVPYFCPVPFIITVHDLILHEYPNSASFLKRAAYRFLMDRAVEKAQKIIVVSKATEAQMALHYKKSQGRMVHISNGLGSEFVPQPKEKVDALLQKLQIATPYFLYVGNAKQHKNVQMLIDAFENAHLSDTQLLLVTGGKESSTLKLPAGVRIMSDIKQDDLPSFYSGAKAFVTASLSEGFGLPVVEAAGCGCPIIVSNRGSLPEVAPSNALIIEPTKEEFSRAFQNPPQSPGKLSFETWEQVGASVEKLFAQV